MVSQMPGIGLISNPFSKKNRKKPERLEEIKKLIPDKSFAKFPTSYEEMDLALELFKRKNIDILAINGGDGTIHVAITHLIKIYGDHPLPKIAVLKGGTMNMVATDIKVKGDTLQILKNLAEKYKKKEPYKIVTRRLLKVGENYGFIFGNGVVCSFMDIYHKGGDPSPWVAAKSLGVAVRSIILRDRLYNKLFKAFNAEVIADKFSFGHKPYIAVLISSLNEIGLGFKLLHRNQTAGDALHMTALLDGSKVRIISQLGRVWFGRSIPPTMGDDTIATNFYIKSDKPFKYTIDGDFYNSAGHLLVQTVNSVDLIVG